MTNAEKIAAVERWQRSGYVHPLTCGGDSSHEDLVAVEENGEVVLKCKNCDYIQRWIPDVVLNTDPESLKPWLSWEVKE